MSEDRKQALPYEGPERRLIADRRQGMDRRQEIRYEPDPDKEDRRSSNDRRKHGGWDNTFSRY